MMFAGAALSAAWLLVGWLDGVLAPGAGGIWLALTALLGGIAIRIRQGRPAQSCAWGPRLRPLQVSCFGAIALGVQLLQAAESGALLAALPFLALPWLAPLCILAGMAGLAGLSIASDCRDAEFSRGVLEEYEYRTS